MKRLLIIYPHWPPSNLAGIHRPRLIGNFISEFGWKPVVLTVKREFYEEKPDSDIGKTVSSEIEVHYTDAYKPLKRFRFFGDIGLRSFVQLYREAKKIIIRDKIDFVWIPIPSFYTAVLGRVLNNKTRIPYGIDYIDPWVNGFTDYSKPFSKAWLSNGIAKILEPYAVKNAALISGVSKAYYEPVLERNFKNRKIETIGMPYGFDPNDHKIKIDNLTLPWKSTPIRPVVYAGAFLPKSHLFINLLFRTISFLKKSEAWDFKNQFFFIGTGNYPGKTINDYARQYEISDIVHELPERLPFLQILNLLAAAAGVIVIGSTEKHYTASKIFQSLLSQKPVFAMFHERSTAVQILQEADASAYLCTYSENIDIPEFETKIKETLLKFLNNRSDWNPNYDALSNYSARKSALLLANKLDIITERK